jgi:carotenoid 1,2-hydratase
VNLRFAPCFKHEPIQRRFFSRNWSQADHHWVIANPLCDVTGQIEIADAQASEPMVLEISGRGYHDHNYGTGPIGPGLRRWMWGRVLMPGHAAMFHFAQPSDPGFADEVHLMEAEHLGQRVLSVDRFNADWNLKTSTLLKYPAWVEAGALQLSNPTVVDASPFFLRLCYQASLRGVSATALCEIAYPHRIGWPVIGRMIEKSIQREQTNR